MWCYVDGTFVAEEDARVPITDRSFLYGDGCFEGIAVHDGRIVDLDEHVARLQRSARMLQIRMPLDAAALRDALVRTAARNELHGAKAGYLRAIVSRGSGFLGLRNTRRLGDAHLYVIAQIERACSDVAPVYRAAISRVLAAPPSMLDPRIKSNNYLPHVLAMLDAEQKGADVAIRCDASGFVSEGHAMNLLCIRGRQLRSSPEAVALAGLTRRRVIEVAKEQGLQVVECPLTAYDLINADEVILTGSVDGVAAISSIDGIPLPAPIPGPVTALLRRRYLARVLRDGTPVPCTPDVGPVVSKATKGASHHG